MSDGWGHPLLGSTIHTFHVDGREIGMVVWETGNIWLASHPTATWRSYPSMQQAMEDVEAQYVERVLDRPLTP